MIAMPLADNPAINNPRKALTSYQQDALCTINFYKIVRFKSGYWLAGKKSFKHSSIMALVGFNLLQISGNSLTLTVAGKLVIDKLTGENQ
ncbi:hypothetical protein RvVAT039_02460 [Agrobacterium vitis]|uniref:hypothetical protein n=1 Tax=Rhizobium/Agrobacterium group TaxID=227290 RepID=UPI0015D863FD|nr:MULTISPECIES: hypothetical protein [Rhizobium/Agrobacterium group]MCF1471170.1 hypothetical protein [Allorhizobium ampelinum]BCH59169.1 hypothetical protein RvVAR0630_17930 [Agrobacterium vitis]BCH63030.1 hypothetical protein RvVAT039_02460 [Agrobacterium vitis]